MAVPGFLTNYISRNYRRLLVCVRASREDEREREHSDHHSTNINTNQRERRRPTSGCFSVPGDMYQEPDRDEVFQRDDPLRGCMAPRKSGPRDSGDFVAMGCMQI